MSDADKVKRLAARLRELSDAVTRADWSEFSMRVPVERERDADLVLSDAADLLEREHEEAERYRWLRDGNAYFPEEQMIEGGSYLDEAIDAARAAEQPAKSSAENVEAGL